MKTPKISVCLPTFNGAKYLAEAIESVLNQSIEDLELVIGDDGSTDETKTIVESYAKQDSRISHVFNAKNVGYLGNTNLILKRCRGQYIKTFAQDDAFEPRCFERMLASIESSDRIAVVAVSRRHVDARGVEIAVQHKFDKTGIRAGEDMIKLYFSEFLNRTGNPSQMFFRRQERVNSFNTSYYHSADTEFALRLLEAGDFYYIAEPLLRYRVHKETTTVTTLEDMSFAQDHVRIVDRFAPYLAEVGLGKDVVWANSIKGLNNKMSNAMSVRGIKYDTDFPIPKNWGKSEENGRLVANDEPEVFRRLACYLIKYVTEKHFAYEELEHRILDTQREKEAIKKHNQQLIERISQLEKEVSDSQCEMTRARDSEQELKKQIEHMKNSTSWKLTKTLRKLR
jgi:glycosyltransferase involved in cell wall biosynthesis